MPVPIRAIVVTKISCDSAVCPCPNSLRYEHPQSVALRLARQAGWLVGIEIICPACQSAGVVAAGGPPPRLLGFLRSLSMQDLELIAA